MWYIDLLHFCACSFPLSILPILPIPYFFHDRSSICLDTDVWTIKITESPSSSKWIWNEQLVQLILLWLSTVTAVSIKNKTSSYPDHESAEVKNNEIILSQTNLKSSEFPHYNFKQHRLQSFLKLNISVLLRSEKLVFL